MIILNKIKNQEKYKYNDYDKHEYGIIDYSDKDNLVVEKLCQSGKKIFEEEGFTVYDDMAELLILQMIDDGEMKDEVIRCY